MFDRLFQKLDEYFEAPKQHCECCGYEFYVYDIYIGSDGSEYCKPCIHSLALKDYYEHEE